MTVRLSALRAGSPLPPGRFLVLISVRSWVDPQGHSAAGRIRSNHFIGNRTSDLPAYSVVPQPSDTITINLNEITRWLWTGHRSAAVMNLRLPQNAGNLTSSWAVILKNSSAPWTQLVSSNFCGIRTTRKVEKRLYISSARSNGATGDYFKENELGRPCSIHDRISRQNWMRVLSQHLPGVMDETHVFRPKFEPDISQIEIGANLTAVTCRPCIYLVETRVDITRPIWCNVNSQ
jgi:hypothetical protein